MEQLPIKSTHAPSPCLKTTNATKCCLPMPPPCALSLFPFSSSSRALGAQFPPARRPIRGPAAAVAAASCRTCMPPMHALHMQHMPFSLLRTAPECPSFLPLLISSCPSRRFPYPEFNCPLSLLCPLSPSLPPSPCARAHCVPCCISPLPFTLSFPLPARKPIPSARALCLSALPCAASFSPQLCRSSVRPSPRGALRKPLSSSHLLSHRHRTLHASSL